MRLNALFLIGVLTVAAVPLSAGVASAAGDRTSGSQAAQSAERCPAGYYWEPDAYAVHGKFRPAHCAPRW